MARMENRGRPQAYTFSDRRHFAELIRQFGARGAREASSRRICLHTLLKIAKEFQIQLKKGRRRRFAA